MSDRIYVGLDMSLTGTGFCIKVGDEEVLKTIKTSPADFDNEFDRLNFITGEVMSQIDKCGKPLLICIENYFTPHDPRQMGSAIKLVQLGTLMRMKMYEGGYPFVVVAPSQIKKFCLGKGSGSKSLVLKGVYKKWDVDASDDNQADAYVMTRIAEAITNYLGPEKNDFPKYELEVIKKIVKDAPAFNVQL